MAEGKQSKVCFLSWLCVQLVAGRNLPAAGPKLVKEETLEKRAAKQMGQLAETERSNLLHIASAMAMASHIAGLVLADAHLRKPLEQQRYSSSTKEPFSLELSKAVLPFVERLA